MAYLDYSKSFDRVPHDIFLNKSVKYKLAAFRFPIG